MSCANNFQGIAFCEYANEELTAVALEGLNGMEIGDSVLKVQKACVGFQQASGLEMGVNAMSMLAGTTSTDLEHGRVLQLLNMVTPEELLDSEEYEGKRMFYQISWYSVLTFIHRNCCRCPRRVREVRPSTRP